MPSPQQANKLHLNPSSRQGRTTLTKTLVTEGEIRVGKIPANNRRVLNNISETLEHTQISVNRPTTGTGTRLRSTGNGALHRARIRLWDALHQASLPRPTVAPHSVRRPNSNTTRPTTQCNRQTSRRPLVVSRCSPQTIHGTWTQELRRT